MALKATLLSTVGVFLTAGFIMLFCRLALRMDWLASLLIGAVISSTDAASVFSIMRGKRLGMKYNTASLLELESGSNDPSAYMLTAVVLSVMIRARAPSARCCTWYSRCCHTSIGVNAVLRQWPTNHVHD